MSKRKTAQGASDSLVNLIIALLAPMFLWSCKGDVALARAAAAETLAAYCAADNLTLIRAAKVLALDPATLSSISLSMVDDTSASLALRLRGNAVSLDRSAERNRAALEKHRRNAAIAARTAETTAENAAAAVTEAQLQVQQAQARAQPPEPQAPARAMMTERPSASRTPVPERRAPTTEHQRKTARAEVAEMTAGLNTLSPAERAADHIRIEALAQTATALSSGTALPPYLAASSVAVPPPPGR